VLLSWPKKYGCQTCISGRCKILYFQTMNCPWHCQPGYYLRFSCLLSAPPGKCHHSFIPLAFAEFDDSVPFSAASSIPLCYLLFPATFLNQLFFHPLSPHLASYFLVYLSILFFPNSYIYSFWNPIFFHSLYMPKPT
jgi:hypothetical protein